MRTALLECARPTIALFAYRIARIDRVDPSLVLDVRLACHASTTLNVAQNYVTTVFARSNLVPSAASLSVPSALLATPVKARCSALASFAALCLIDVYRLLVPENAVDHAMHVPWAKAPAKEMTIVKLNFDAPLSHRLAWHRIASMQRWTAENPTWIAVALNVCLALLS